MNSAELETNIGLVLRRPFLPRFDGTVSEWAQEFVRFNEPGRVGQFSLHEREYLREPLDAYGIDDITDIVLCFGTRTGKTTVMFAGMAFRAHQKARRCLFVKPGAKGTAGAEGDARTRFIPMLRASPKLAELIPSGATRHNFKTAQQMLRNGSILDWTGSNSVANLASNSMEDVYLDETDKFNATRRRDEEGNVVEADACDLADERTAEFRFPKRVKASTPTLISGRIWFELHRTDLRRRFVPCPLCGRDHPSSRLVVIAWREDYTLLAKRFGYGTPREPNSPIPLAFVDWDNEAKRPDGSWDLARVERSAGYRCPHCGGRFNDEQKSWQDRQGVWIPTQKGAPRMAGFHLPSMYSAHEQTTVGRLALDFLEGVHSVEGPRNFINSKLSEPYGGQDVAGKRIEVAQRISTDGDGWSRQMTVDCQANAPYFWYVIRAFGNGKSVGLKCGSCDTWDELRKIQLENKVPDASVIVDSGYGAKDDHEVYRVCATYGELVENQGQPWVIGWMPCKMFPGRRNWRDPETGAFVHYFLREKDPFEGTADAHRVKFHLFEYAKDYYLDILDRLRRNKATDFLWTIAPEMDTDEYHEHMRGRIRKPVIKFGKEVMEWARRHRDAKDHLFSCEEMHVAGASYFGFLGEKIELTETEAKEQ